MHLFLFCTHEMNKNDLFHFGHIIKTQGFEGHLLIAMDVDDTSRYQKLEEVFIEEKENTIERYAVAGYTLNKNKTCTILLEGIDSFENARHLLKKNVFLPLSLLPRLKGTSFYLHEIRGFTVIDQAAGKIGIAESVIELPHQNILLVKNGKHEILLPLQSNLIISIDRQKKILNYNAPEGLIEMYLGMGDR